MKIRILAPEVTVAGTKYESGKEVSVGDEHEREISRLVRSGYVLVLEDSAPRRATATKSTKED